MVLLLFLKAFFIRLLRVGIMESPPVTWETGMDTLILPGCNSILMIQSHTLLLLLLLL